MTKVTPVAIDYLKRRFNQAPLMVYLDPRCYLAAGIGWSMVVLILATALIGANLAAREARERARADAERLLTQFAIQTRHTIDLYVEKQRATLQAAAALMGAHPQGLNAANIPRHLQALKAQFPELTWLGLADALGQIVAAEGGVLQDTHVANRPWFQKGREGGFIDDAHDVPLVGETPPASPIKDPRQGLFLAVPIKQPSGEVIGVLGGRLSWAWMTNQEENLLRKLEAHRSIDLLVATSSKIVVLGQPSWLGQILTEDTDFTEGGRYLACHNIVPPEQQQGYGWFVALREETGTALARAQMAYLTVFRVVLVGGLVAALIAAAITLALTSRLASLDIQARAIRQGTQDQLIVPPGKDEISRIGATLADLIEHLQQEKRALVTLNAELDARVAERTARIERLAEEARYAAITRERLRLARELHDTLAHSLMALLTQIRLIRKLRGRFDLATLDEELERAEEAAATGLTEARAAITQMRHNSVRDEGLGAALEQLLQRFQERCGINTVLEADTQAADLADDRAETLFRIMEEALNNVERHAEAQTVTIKLQWLESLPSELLLYWNSDYIARMRIEIADDGVGFDPTVPCPGHYGLDGIREQAVLIQADFELHSQPGVGTRLVIEFTI